MPAFLRALVIAFCLCFASLQAKAASHADWTTPLPPFQIADNLYYVGSRDLAAYLITTPAGNILINANLKSSPSLIRASVQKLGFSWKDTKILLNGQAHSDHMGGAAEVLRETHAQDMVMEGDADVVRTGGRSDFAFGTDGMETYPPARVDRVLYDGDTVVLGGVTLTAHRTGGHTRGCNRLDIPHPHRRRPPQAACGMSSSSADGGRYRSTGFSAPPGHPASYPGIRRDFYQTFATLQALPCDIFLGAHDVYFDLLPKVKRMQTEGEAAFIDPKGYREAVSEAKADFDETVAAQTPKK